MIVSCQQMRASDVSRGIKAKKGLEKGKKKGEGGESFRNAAI